MKPNRPPLGGAVEGTGRARRRCGRMWMGHAQLRVVRRLSAPPKQASKQVRGGRTNGSSERSAAGSSQRNGDSTTTTSRTDGSIPKPQHTHTHTHTHTHSLLASTHLPVAAGAAGGAHLRAGLHARGLHVPAARPRAFVPAIACLCVYVSVVSVVSGLNFTRGRDQEPADPGRKIDLTLRPCSAPGKQGPEQMAAVVASRISYIRRRREGDARTGTARARRTRRASNRM